MGASQLDITPEPGGQLAGFAARTQPSTGVLDSLFARCVYLADGDERLLWVHTDLVGLERSFVLDFRRWAQQRLGLEPRQVMLSATHTHSGPATIHIEQAGEYDAPYIRALRSRLETGAEQATQETEVCDVVAVEGRLALAVDRRMSAPARADQAVGGIGWRRRDGAFVAVVVNYAMHPVALGSSNRRISADVPGQTARVLSARLPGAPVVLATNGACGNLNPPALNVPHPQVAAWGTQIATSVADRLSTAPAMSDAGLRVRATVVPLPLEVLSVEQIEAQARRSLADASGLAEWGGRYRQAVENWRRTMSKAVQRGDAADHHDAELFAVRIGQVALLGVNAEVFSHFAEAVRQRTGKVVYVVGYANGLMGYLPTAAAYEEGGYEVETAHLFYASFRPRAGGLELLVERGSQLVRETFG